MAEYDRTFEGEVVQLCKLAVQPPHIIERVAFKNCRLVGPAILVMSGQTIMDGCAIEGDAASVVWEVPEDRDLVVGAVGLRDCLIMGGSLSSIGFALKPSQIPEFWAGTGTA